MVKINIANAFDNVMESTFGINETSVDEWIATDRATTTAYPDEYPAFDPIVSFEEFLCNDDYIDSLKCRLDTTQELRLLPQGPAEKRWFRDDSTNLHKPDKKRKGRATGAHVPDPEPRTGLAMEVVINNEVPLLYIAQMAYRPATPGNPDAPRPFIDSEIEGEFHNLPPLTRLTSSKSSLISGIGKICS